MRAISFVIVSLFAISAGAVPLQLTHQGRLLDSSDVPLSGTHSVTFVLWGAATGTNVLWSDVYDVTFDNGFYGVALGDGGNPIDENVLDNAEVWLSLSIGGEELLPRQRVVSAPYAVMAGSAENVVGGIVDASSISVGGNEIIDSSGDWVGAPPSDTLGALGCADGQVPQQTSSGWTCGNAGADTLAALGCTGGQVAKWNGTAWACAADDDTDTDTLAALTVSCNLGDVPKYDGSSGWDCLPDAMVTSVDGLGGGNVISGVTVDGDVSVWRDNKALVVRQDGTNSYISNKANFVNNGADPNGVLYINGSGGVELKYGDEGTSGYTGLRLDTAGQVGIGKTSPTSTLDVNGTVTWSALNGPAHGRLSGWDAGSEYDSLLPGTVAGNSIEGPLNAHLAVGLRGNDSNDSFSVCVDSDFDGTLDTVGLAVNSAGNVGVGTAIPQAALDVRGNVLVSGEVVGYQRDVYMDESSNTIGSTYIHDGSNEIFFGRSTRAGSCLLIARGEVRVAGDPTGEIATLRVAYLREASPRPPATLGDVTASFGEFANNDTRSAVVTERVDMPAAYMWMGCRIWLESGHNAQELTCHLSLICL